MISLFSKMPTVSLPNSWFVLTCELSHVGQVLVSCRLGNIGDNSGKKIEILLL